MMRDPRWTGAVVVSLPEELAVEETLELVPRATKSLGRPMLAVLVNRSVSRLVKDEAKPAWLETLRDHAPPNVVAGLEGIHAELVGRLHFERQLRRELAGATQRGIFALDEQLALGIDGAPREIVAAMASSFDAAEAEVA